jgi:hypothetical protein
MDEMAGMDYIVLFYIEWNDGTTSGGTLKFQATDLRGLFNLLYEKVVTGSIADAELYNPEMINEITIDILKKPHGRFKTHLRNDKEG